MKRQPGGWTRSEEDRHVLAAWAAAGAERTLARFETHAPGDARPRAAIDAALTNAHRDRRAARGALSPWRQRSRPW